eukprot:NODE_2283_length_607_cov_69.075000_g2233_i0.p1 GENE.NODE_2283_length_607_cov_69.075000_g2233_i0~~NODE_2283_length_607_cov_69.075000_g2233_i0.p1  ORF type:complete len:190 (-),score=43.50 NODE_2283_length_607_cov_69.075000_g2233_i0:37-534(-)
MQWYDFDYPHALRMTRTTRFELAHDIHVGTDLWMANELTQECVYVDIGIGPLKPDWLVGGEYLGEGHMINSVPSYLFNKDGAGNDHLYYCAMDNCDVRPTRMDTINNEGNENTKEYVNMVLDPIPRDVFDVPRYCPPADKSKKLDVGVEFLVDYEIVHKRLGLTY